MNNQIKDNKIIEMSQYWIDTADQNTINIYAKNKLIEWYKDQSEDQVNDFYSNHLEQTKEDKE